MILVDTSIWIDHINKGPDQNLIDLLEGQSVAVHPFVIGEIAMGSITARLAQLTFLNDLPRLSIAREIEVRSLVENQQLYASGLSYIDAHLLTSVVAAGASRLRLWTRDKKLRTQAARLGVAFAA